MMAMVPKRPPLLTSLQAWARPCSASPGKTSSRANSSSLVLWLLASQEVTEAQPGSPRKSQATMSASPGRAVWQRSTFWAQPRMDTDKWG